MMMNTRQAALLAFIFLIFAHAQTARAALDVDISEPDLKITTGFTGDTLTLFGTADPKGDIVILVKGPKHDTTIRRKDEVMGLWVKTQSVEFADVHGYYNVASSRPIAEIAPPATRLGLKMGINSLTFTPTDEDISLAKADRFEEALIQNKQLNGLYALTPNAIDFINDHLFKTRITMPPNVPLGAYEIEAFLFKDGELIDRTSHPFFIRQVGLAAEVHDFATDAPFYYGVTVILIALFSSFLAIILLRRD